MKKRELAPDIKTKILHDIEHYYYNGKESLLAIGQKYGVHKNQMVWLQELAYHSMRYKNDEPVFPCVAVDKSNDRKIKYIRDYLARLKKFTFEYNDDRRKDRGNRYDKKMALEQEIKRTEIWLSVQC